MADAFTQVIQMAQTLEFVLTQRYQAVGRGLHEKLTSVEDQIPEAARKQIRFIATIRNKAAHDDVAIAEQNLSGVTNAYRSALNALNGKAAFEESGKRPVVENYDLTYGLSPVDDRGRKSKLSLERSAPKTRNNRGQYNQGANVANNRRPAPIDLASVNRYQGAQNKPARSYANNKNANRQGQNKRSKEAKRDRERVRLLLVVVGGLTAIVVLLLALLLAATLKKDVKDSRSAAQSENAQRFEIIEKNEQDVQDEQNDAQK